MQFPQQQQKQDEVKDEMMFGAVASRPKNSVMKLSPAPSEMKLTVDDVKPIFAAPPRVLPRESIPRVPL